MKATGIVRKLDELGRVALPVSLRRKIGIGDREPLEIFIDGDYIVLKKHVPICCFCEGTEDIKLYHGRKVCAECITTIFNNTKAV